MIEIGHASHGFQCRTDHLYIPIIIFAVRTNVLTFPRLCFLPTHRSHFSLVIIRRTILVIPCSLYLSNIESTVSEEVLSALVIAGVEWVSLICYSCDHAGKEIMVVNC